MRLTRRALAYMALLFALVLAAGGCGGSATPTLKMVPPAQSAMGSVHPPNWGAPVWGPHPGGLLPRVQLTATMFDSISLSPIAGLDHFALAGYTDGHWQTYLPMRAKYPKAHTVSIAVFSSDHADCGDFEPGDMVPAQVVAWVRGDLAHGFAHPCVYSSLWEFTNEIRPLLAAAHFPRALIFEWDADYTFVPHIDPTFDETQWTDAYLGLNADASLGTLAFLSIAQPPYVRPVNKPVVCFGKGALHTHGCLFVQKEVAAWHKQAAADLANAARVTRNWSWPR